MAKASWCNVSPMSGKRDGVLTISAGAHTGRVARNTVVTVSQYSGISGRCRGIHNHGYKQTGPSLFRRSR